MLDYLALLLDAFGIEVDLVTDAFDKVSAEGM